jgi:hypothetical protein
MPKMNGPGRRRWEREVTVEHSRAVGCGVTSSSARHAQPHGHGGLLGMAHTIDPPRLLGVHATSVTLHHGEADEGIASSGRFHTSADGAMRRLKETTHDDTMPGFIRAAYARGGGEADDAFMAGWEDAGDEAAAADSATQQERREQREELDVGVNSVAWVAGRGGGFVSGGDDGVVRVWDAVNGECRRSFEDHRHADEGEGVRAIHLMGKRLVVGGTDEVLRVYS